MQPSEFCRAGHPVTDFDEYRQRVGDIQPWPDFGLVIAPCLCCGSHLSYPSDLPEVFDIPGAVPL